MSNSEPVYLDTAGTILSGEGRVASGATPPTEESMTVQYVFQTTVHGVDTYYLKSSDGMRWLVEEIHQGGNPVLFRVETWTQFGWEDVVTLQNNVRRASAVEDAVRAARAILVS